MRIVSIGGGTGLSTLLSGLKAYVDNPQAGANSIETLTAVVTVTDDGGSSGRLREEFQILPPGDIRNCMVALAEDERLLTRLFQYRFESDGDLSGHSFGNIFLAALAGVTGDFVDAIKVTSEVLAIKGRIYPSTVEDVTLLAEVEGGKIIEGETRIVESRSPIKKLWLSRENCRPLQETLDSIAEADIITIGPGSLYTSLIPSLLVHGIVEAINSSPALKLYVCNVMTQPGETNGFSAEDHLRVLFEYSPELRLDYVVANSTLVTKELREKYLSEGAIQVRFSSGLERASVDQQVALDLDAEGSCQALVVCEDLLNENDVVRHDPHKLARLLLTIYQHDRSPAISRVYTP
ncbi:MAG TPA: gluconeogenesis factor YvcK family protein [Blastocatellia bacterium]|nr:gluconeogenesis factor YvcK family protein [Blastocatellia bacterium]